VIGLIVFFIQDLKGQADSKEAIEERYSVIKPNEKPLFLKFTKNNLKKIWALSEKSAEPILEKLDL
jgi:hypothetical protein